MEGGGRGCGSNTVQPSPFGVFFYIVFPTVLMAVRGTRWNNNMNIIIMRELWDTVLPNPP